MADLKLIAGAYAVRMIESHVRDIGAAAAPHHPRDVDPYYSYWVGVLENVRKIVDGELSG